MYTILYFNREGSVIAEFVINFQESGNATILLKAEKALNESLTQSQNISSFRDLQIDPASVTLEGRKQQT